MRCCSRCPKPLLSLYRPPLRCQATIQILKAAVEAAENVDVVKIKVTVITSYFRLCTDRAFRGPVSIYRRAGNDVVCGKNRIHYLG